MGNVNFFKRLFLFSFCQKGFHRFWRIWNPFYGYFLFRLFRFLGGNRNKKISTILVFFLCGYVLHDLPIYLLFGKMGFVCTFAFLFYGIVSLVTAKFERFFYFDKNYILKNVSINITLIVIGFVFGTVSSDAILKAI